MELERFGVQDLVSTIAAPSHSSSSKESPRRDKARRLEAAAKVGETRISLLRKTSGRARRMRHQKSIHASYARDLAESLNALNGENLSLVCKEKKRSKRRREKSPHSGCSTPIKLRWRANLVGTCMWKPLSMVSHYKPC